MKFLSLFLTLIVLIGFSCVPQQQYAELEQTLNYYKSETLATDSIKAANLQIQQETNQTQADYQSLTRELESLKATNISLNTNYQDIVARYNSLVGDNQRVLATTSYETTTLEQELALRQEELERKERSLSQMEIQARSRDAELQRLEARSTAAPVDYSSVPDARFQDLRAQKAALNQQRNQIIAYLQRVLVGFPNEEVAIAATNEGVSLTLSENLLFPQGDNATVYWKGRQALQQIAVVLRDYPALPVRITGHANPSTNVDADLEVSFVRAIAVAKDLNAYSVDAARLLPTALGSNQPIVPATNSRAQIVNGRTVIDIALDFSGILLSLD
jgi:chemotaxis protein MotB